MIEPTRPGASFVAIWSRMFVLARRSWKGVFAYSGGLGIVFALIDYFDIGSGANTGAGIASLMVSAGITGIVADEYVHGDDEARRDATQDGSQFLTLFGASLLTGFGVLLGLVFLVVPGLVLGAWWGLHQPLIVREQAGVMDSIRISRERVRGSVAACALVWFVAWGIWLVGYVGTMWNAPLEGGIPMELAVAEVIVVMLLFPLLPLAASAMYDLLRPVDVSAEPTGSAVTA